MARRRYQRPNVQRTAAKRPRWYFRARVDVRTEQGTERREQPFYLGFCAEMGKREAERQRDAILAEAINRPQVLIQSQVKFSELLKAFRQDHLPTVREITRRNYEFVIGKHLDPAFGQKRLCDIGPREVQQWVNGLKGATSSRKLALRVFAAIWSRAVAWNYTQTVCPAQWISLGQPKQVYQREIPTKDQFRRILALLPEIHRDICELVVTTGMRISEVRGLPARAVDFGARCLRVEQRLDRSGGFGPPKSSRGERLLPLGHMAERLRRYVRPGMAPDALLFRVSYEACHAQLLRAAELAGFKAVGFGHHSLRAANATWLRKGGLSREDAKQQLGHSSDQVADLYLRAEAEDYRRREAAVLALQAELMGETGAIQ